MLPCSLYMKGLCSGVRQGSAGLGGDELDAHPGVPGKEEGQCVGVVVGEGRVHRLGQVVLDMEGMILTPILVSLGDAREGAGGGTVAGEGED